MVQQRVPQEPALWPHQVGVIPSRAQFFQHRAEVDRLRAAVDGGGTALLSQVLTGMGGVGKTQLAADYARAAWKDGGLDILVWISASARSPVVTGYAQAAVELCQADPGDPEKAAKQFLAWLEPKGAAKPCRWLVVLDDVADPDDLHGLWPPTSPYGRTLVTTRRRDAALTGEGRTLVDVALFTEVEAVAYLTTSLAGHGRVESVDQLTALASDLGHLPLALSQAAAYLIDSGLGAAAYRDLLADRATALADTAPDRLPDDQTVALAAAWHLSIDRADQLRPAGMARPMLQLAALLDPNGIPQGVLTSQPALTHLAQYRTRTGNGFTEEPDPVSPRDGVRALRALHRLSLIHHTPDNPHQAVRVHQLIQRATRDTLPPDQRDQTARIAAAALLAAWPDDERDTALAQALRANTDVLQRRAQAALLQPELHDVLFVAGASLGQFGQVAAARDHFDRLTDAVRNCHGPDHPDTLATRSQLAVWQAHTGDEAGAATTTEQLLADMMRILGPDHPETLEARGNLAEWRGRLGDVAGAVAALEQLLHDQERIQGPDHLYSFAIRNSLAQWRWESGDVSGGIAALEQLLADRERILGVDHPDTLATSHHLAAWRGWDGDVASAATAAEQRLAHLIQTLGPDHPETLGIRAGLAWWQAEGGNVAGAAESVERLLDDQVRVLGPDHPETLEARGNLAEWRGRLGDVAGAVAALEQLLHDQERVQGTDHPRTLRTRRRIAHWHGETGDAAGAAASFAELLEVSLRVLGPDHTHTLATRHQLTYWQGRAAEGQSNPPAG
ncbi:tetratricopeptide repeat protein [Streptomyces sp. LBUM 1484]|nr:tetratricopeptide repeat protein [Streptomyces sp. LBUM 1484]MBP5886014.1 tetratricopeptide repeat protein [Streptomyces sp. LBUM 1487]QTU67400.1 tetratricopeptide repeat protein [Streptomyces sp. LBUM 1475]UJV46575.1 tetratricopeptide repeat protein [Streptomyces sp. AMCC400023]